MTTELERREAKGGKGCIFVLFLALLLPSMGTCGGIGAKKAMVARSGVVSVDLASVGDEKLVLDGTYVRADAGDRRLRLIARDELPVGDRLVVRARGTSVYGFGSPTTVVACSGSACRALESEPQAGPAHVILEGRVCPTESQIMCPLDEGLKTYLRHEEREGRAHRVLVVGEKPSDNVWEAAIGLGIALALVVLLGGLMLLVNRKRATPPLVATRQLAALRTREEIRAALRAQQWELFRLAEDSPERLTFLAGIPANKAVAMGISGPEKVPRRVEIVFREQAYRALEIHVTVTDIITNARAMSPALAQLVHQSFEHTFQLVAGVR